MTDSNPMADFVEVIKLRWWRSDTPPIPGHHIGKDLSIVKAWLRQGWSREELLGALDLYQGIPATLRITHRQGNRNLINRLVAEWQRREETRNSRVGTVLRQMAEDGVI